jgi:hypothetical protein
MKMGVAELGVNSCGFPVFRAFGFDCLKMFFGQEGCDLNFSNCFSVVFTDLQAKTFEKNYLNRG